MNQKIGLDFETYGDVNLPKYGLARYLQGKYFQPLIASLKWWEDESLRCHRIDFTQSMSQAKRELRDVLGMHSTIVAQNAGFEHGVLDHLGIYLRSKRFLDSAVISRAAGASGRLEAGAPQLLGVDKMPDGKRLIQLFSVPGKYQLANGNDRFDPQVIADNLSDWDLFGDYCDLDAELGLSIEGEWGWVLTNAEPVFQAITQDMNRTGWPVDLGTVEEMQRRYLENQEVALREFREDCGAHDLNLNSGAQLKAWCAERGIKASSFDEKHVATLHKRISDRLAKVDDGSQPLPGNKYNDYCQVLAMLETKQILGGASLKKLATILDTVVDTVDGPRLKDQYLHIGAAQTWRTTGRSVQMQNLKRLAEPADMSELENPDSDWDNEQLASNMRQVFTSSHPLGRLIVGDFSSVESRGLAWLAGAEWKLNAFRQGRDMYKVLAAKMFSIDYDSVLKSQRQTGKVGELSCGYGAGGPAVQAFANGMGVEMTELEAGTLVRDWRATNPEIELFWLELDGMLHDIVEGRAITKRRQLPDGFVLQLQLIEAPISLKQQHPGAHTVMMQVFDNYGRPFMTRFFHGCYSRGRDIYYYKPSELKTGALWKATYVNPKTKQTEFHKLYGGKLAGILTQSFCRELFMRSLMQVATYVSRHADQLTLIGQFHDEIVVDWTPGQVSLADAKATMDSLMSDPGLVRSFPLAAEIKDDYRYTK